MFASGYDPGKLRMISNPGGEWQDARRGSQSYGSTTLHVDLIQHGIMPYLEISFSPIFRVIRVVDMSSGALLLSNWPKTQHRMNAQIRGPCLRFKFRAFR